MTCAFVIITDVFCFLLALPTNGSSSSSSNTDGDNIADLAGNNSSNSDVHNDDQVNVNVSTIDAFNSNDDNEICINNYLGLAFSNDPEQWIFDAVKRGDVDAATSIIRKFALDINSRKQYGKTFLYRAAESGHENIVILLLDQHADPNVACTDGETPLHIAAKLGHNQIVALLLAAGASPDAKDKCGRMALHYAA